MTHGLHLQSSSQTGHSNPVGLELRWLSCKRSANTVKAFLRERTMRSSEWPNSTQPPQRMSLLKNIDLISLFQNVKTDYFQIKAAESQRGEIKAKADGPFFETTLMCVAFNI